MEVYMKRLLICLILLGCLALWADEMTDAMNKAYILRQKSQFNAAAQVLVDFIKGYSGSDYRMETYYSIACYYALDKKKDAAFQYLKLAIDNGFLDYDWIAKDTDFDNIHKDKRWKLYLAQIE